MNEKQRAYHRNYYRLHVAEKRRTGRPIGRPRTDPFDRVMASVIQAENGCWLFTGYTYKGYGSIGVGRGSPLRAHRVVYERLRGPIPDGLQLDHLCRQRNCVNPDHLEAVTPRENTMRSEAFTAHNARKTACKHGHAFTPENTNVFHGHRQCRTCCRAANKRQSEKRKALRHARKRLQ